MRYSGNALVEYVLPLSLVVLLGGAMLWGGDFAGLMQNNLQATNRGTMDNASLRIGRMGVLAPPPSASNLPGLRSGHEQVCFTGSNVCLDLPVINGASGETVGTLGGDIVQRLAAVLQELPGILEELGVDPAVLSLVTDLANQSHTLGEKLKAIQDVCSGGRLCEGPAAQEAFAEFNALKGAELADFLNRWQTLETHLANNPDALAAFPEAHGIIKTKVDEIKGIIASLDATERNVAGRETVGRSGTQGQTYGYFNDLVNAAPHRETVTVDGHTWWKIGEPGSNKYSLYRWTGPNFQQETNGSLFYRDYNVQMAEQGVIFNIQGEDALQIHQNANTICQNGGQTSGQGACLRRVDESAWEPVELPPA